MTSHPETTLLRARSVTERTGLSRTSIYREVKAGKFPAPVQLSERTVAWRSNEVDTWIATRPTVQTASAAA